MGEDQPRPGIGSDQATPSVVLQRSGRPFSALTPEASGPRKQGHSPAPAVAGRRRARTGRRWLLCMAVSYGLAAREARGFPDPKRRPPAEIGNRPRAPVAAAPRP